MVMTTLSGYDEFPIGTNKNRPFQDSGIYTCTGGAGQSCPAGDCPQILSLERSAFKSEHRLIISSVLRSSSLSLYYLLYKKKILFMINHINLGDFSS